MVLETFSISTAILLQGIHGPPRHNTPWWGSLVELGYSLKVKNGFQDSAPATPVSAT